MLDKCMTESVKGTLPDVESTLARVRRNLLTVLEESGYGKVEVIVHQGRIAFVHITMRQKISDTTE